MAKIISEIGNEILDNEDVELNLSLHMIEHCSPKKKEEFGCKSDYSLHIILHGKGVFKTKDNKSAILGSGKAFLLYPGERCSYRPVNDDPWSYMWFSFTGKNIDKMMACCGFTKETPYRDIDDFSEIRALLSEFREENDKTKVEKTTFTAYFLRLISALINTNKERMLITDNGASMKSKRLKEILLYIMSNYRMDISPEEIAKNMHISVGYLNAIVSGAMGMSLTNFINTLRVSHACELLNQSTLSIEEVANSVGFDDPKYFSRVFSRVKGLSPREYRKSKDGEDPFLWLVKKGINYR